MEDDKIQLFEDQPIRTAWVEDEENRIVASEGGAAAGEARAAVEKRTGNPVITNKNATQLQDIVTGLIEANIDKMDD